MALRKKTGRPVPRPFVKWVGGKGQLVETLLARAPERFRRYHEPFVGGGAFFFALRRAGRLGRCHSRLTDVNQELITAYSAIRDRTAEVLAVLQELATRHDKESYLAIRAWDFTELDAPRIAARMIYLNRCGYNGLYRVNRKGQFNVPFGRYKNPRICDAENINAVAGALQKATVSCAPFAAVLAAAAAGDFVYFDPPYVPVSATANFVSYSATGFGQVQQEELAHVFAALAGRGVQVMASNSDMPQVRELYAPFHQHRVQARRSVNSKGGRRGPVGELVITSYAS